MPAPPSGGDAGAGADSNAYCMYYNIYYMYYNMSTYYMYIDMYYAVPPSTAPDVHLVHRDRPAERTAQPLRLHHPELHIVLPDGHAALVEVEQHADAVALLVRGLHPLPQSTSG